jgi:hypothetical protein
MIEPGQQITFSLMKEQLEKEIGYALDFEREDTLRSHLSTLCIEDDSCASSSDSRDSNEALDEHASPGEHLACAGTRTGSVEDPNNCGDAFLEKKTTRRDLQLLNGLGVIETPFESCSNEIASQPESLHAEKSKTGV